MKLNEYLKQSARTEPPESPTYTGADRLIHAVLGIITEMDESNNSVGHENKVEEIGDIMWYWAIIPRMQDVSDIETLLAPSRTARTITGNMSHNVAIIADIAKAWKFYGKLPDWETVNASWANIYRYIDRALTNSAINMADVLDVNVRKLRTRYPDMFTADRAINRDLAAETVVIGASLHKFAVKPADPNTETARHEALKNPGAPINLPHTV